MATSETTHLKKDLWNRDLWNKSWDKIYYGERALKVARGTLFFVALAFTAASKLDICAKAASRMRNTVSDIRYGVLAIMVVGDTGSFARGELLSASKSVFGNTRDSFYYVVDAATLLLFLHDKIPFVKLTQKAADQTWRYISTFWILGSTAGLAEAIRKSVSDPKRQDQKLLKRLANRDTVVATADLTYSLFVIGEAPSGLADAAAVAGGLKLLPEKKEELDDA